MVSIGYSKDNDRCSGVWALYFNFQIIMLQ